jgi:hypothetical protein
MVVKHTPGWEQESQDVAPAAEPMQTIHALTPAGE